MAAEQRSSNGAATATLLLLTMLSIACGGFIGISLLAPVEAPSIDIKDAVPAGSDEADKSQDNTMERIESRKKSDFILKPFPTIITNLAEPKDSWIRVEGHFLMKKETLDPDTVALRTGQGILTYLRTVKLRQIEGASAFLFFRDDINDLALTVSDGQISEVLLQSLVVE